MFETEVQKILRTSKGLSDEEKAQKIGSYVIEHFRTIHSRALAAHCECLGMNAENMWAAIANSNPVYLSMHYFEMMQKWGLVDEKGKPLI
jgi:hypothetical protein